jgi:hypothetical protein
VSAAVRIALPQSVTGIYHLVASGVVVYVGQSKNVFARVGGWLRSRQGVFDEAVFYPCDEAALDALERAHIENFQPRLNVAGRGRAYIGVARSLPKAVIEHGSIDAYLNTLPAHINGHHVRQCGLAINNTQILAIPDFPRPARAYKRRNLFGPYWQCLWRREDVRQWFVTRDAERTARPHEAA